MIDVAFTRADLRAADVAVVIDVLRATSTATQALASGYRRVLCVESVERAPALRAPGRVLAGERACVRPPGFDQGNSPAEAARRRGEELVLATTNGAPAVIAATRTAGVVLLGCLLNLDAVVAALEGADVQVVCAGTDGAVALEDVYVAGRISARLTGRRTDAALVAEAVANAHATAFTALASSADGAALRSAGLGGDIDLCAKESTLEAVGRVAGAAADGVATVIDANATVTRCRAPSFSA